MKAIREWQATRQWGRLASAAERRPAGPMRWSTDARVLCLLREDDAAARNFVDRMRWESIGIDASLSRDNKPGPALSPTCITWADTPDKSPERADSTWTPAQLNFAGLLRTEVLQDWRTREFDFVINLFPNAFAPVDHFCASCRAHLRIAMHEECLEAYDLILRPTPGGGVEGYAAELARYLRVLNPGHAR